MCSLSSSYCWCLLQGSVQGQKRQFNTLLLVKCWDRLQKVSRSSGHIQWLWRIVTRLLEDCNAPFLKLGKCSMNQDCTVALAQPHLLLVVSSSCFRLPWNVPREDQEKFSSIHSMILPHPNMYAHLHMNSRSCPQFSYIHKPNLCPLPSVAFDK